MNSHLFPAVRAAMLSLFLSAVLHAPAAAQLSLTDGADNLASQIATAVTKEQKQKIAVLPFRELTGNSNYFGAYLAEDLITRLFQLADFDIVERSMLDRLLEELKLGESGLIDPETAKKVGKVAGVDAVVTGTMTDLPTSIAVNCRLIDVETGRVFAAAQARIFKDDDVVAIWKTPAPSVQTAQIGHNTRERTTVKGGGREEGAGGANETQSANQPFLTSDYTLTAGTLRVRGVTIEMDLVITSERDDTIRFGLLHPYLLDSEGSRYELERRDDAGFVEQGVEVLPHAKRQTELSFSARNNVVGRRWQLSETEESVSIKGGAFIFAADEILNGRFRGGRKIIMKVHEFK